MAVEPNHPLLGTVLNGRYHLVHLIGQGGMGEVFEAYDQKRKRPLAIKLLRAEFGKDVEWCKRFERECEIASKIESPYVARVLYGGTARTGRRWIACELLEGESLERRLGREGKLAFSEADWMMEHMLLGLHAAHSQGVIHRDIKPGNLFVVQTGPRLVVLDFGVAKRTSGQSTGLTGHNAALGTPSYMSPEQLMSSKDVDPTTDLYSAGLVVYRILSGRLPFQHRDWTRMLESKRSDPLPPLTLASGLTWPDAIDAWLLHMVAAQREERFSSAIAALRAWEVVRAAMQGHVQCTVSASQLREVDTDLDPDPDTK
jgi:serine/threonine-protein kinase